MNRKKVNEVDLNERQSVSIEDDIIKFRVSYNSLRCNKNYWYLITVLIKTNSNLKHLSKKSKKTNRNRQQKYLS